MLSYIISKQLLMQVQLEIALGLKKKQPGKLSHLEWS